MDRWNAGCPKGGNDAQLILAVALQPPGRSDVFRTVSIRISSAAGQVVTDLDASGYGYRLRIKNLPEDRNIEGFDVRGFEVGKVYEVGPRLGELLIVMGYADPVAPRIRDRAADEG